MSQTKRYDCKLVVTTLQSMHQQTSMYLGIGATYPEKSTVNEHLGINRDVLPDANQHPQIKYLIIGNGAHKETIIKGIPSIPTPVRHEPTDAVPYSIMPLVLRPMNNDLTDQERARYRLRRLETHNEVRYWAYYAKVIDMRASVVQDYQTTVVDGVKTQKEFVYTDQNLYPKPSAMPNHDFEVTDKVLPANGKYVNTGAAVTISMTEFDVQEYLNVCKIKYNNPMAAVISELALCTGVDKLSTGESQTGSSFEYTEAVGVQSAIFVSTFSNLALDNDGAAYRITVGQSSPFVAAPATAGF